MSVLITGGAGFIGSNFIRYFMEKNPEEKVVCLDKLTYAGNMENLSFVLDNPNFTFVRGDICKKADVERIFQQNRIKTVINFAAESHVDRSIQDATSFLQTNVVGVQILLDACVKYGIQRFHQISTDEVYGDTSLKSKRKFKETDRLQPNSPYSATKAAADLLVLSYYRTYGVPITISRSSNNYGPNQHSEKFIPLMIKKALANEPLPIYGTGKNIRDWMFVEDHCRAIDVILKKGIVGQIYNVGVQEERSNLQMLNALSIFLLKRVPSIQIKHIEDRKGHDLRYSLNIDKIRNLGWSPKTTFIEGLRTTVGWYLKNTALLEKGKEAQGDS